MGRSHYSHTAVVITQHERIMREKNSENWLITGATIGKLRNFKRPYGRYLKKTVKPSKAKMNKEPLTENDPNYVKTG